MQYGIIKENRRENKETRKEGRQTGKKEGWNVRREKTSRKVSPYFKGHKPMISTINRSKAMQKKNNDRRERKTGKKDGWNVRRKNTKKIKINQFTFKKTQTHDK